jgi:carboxyl-terminal processing protease
MNRTLKVLVTLALSLVTISAVFVGGFVLGHTLDIRLPGEKPAIDTRLGDKVEEVERLLSREALSPASESSRTAGAISGLLEASGDTYATYFDPEHYDYFNQQSGGEFFGIGVNIAEKEGEVYVVSVMEGTPAEEAGLEAEDQFVTIDGVERDSWTVDEVVTRVRGPEGSVVEVEVYRPAEEKIFEFQIERARIEIPNTMQKMVGEDVGYIRLLSFNAKSAADLRLAMEELEAEGAKGFVIDVRDNPGGLLDSAVDVASLFIEDGVIVSVEDRNGRKDVDRANGDVATDAPVVVLMNGNSASASEVLAGALQDYGRATLVGEQSFGKGSVQTVESLSFGGGVKFTIAHYLTPKDRKIDGVGLTPDVIVEMEPELQADEETDTQLKRAAEVLRAEF